MSITNKYSRLIGWIEDVFEDSEAEILSVTEIVDLIQERFNPRHPLTQRRVSHFLRRRSQFHWCLSARMVNSNMFEHWYSLGPTTWQKNVYVIGNWVVQGIYSSSYYEDESDINLICISWNKTIR
jgi:hypothetical protein|tara:strand:+ start:1414 stop:1788 length:375 start_codon:yes stop_codon:yes gene_type:complete